MDPDTDALMDQLSAHLQAEAGLVFRPEQLATYLTALQTKGFVILSGMSGTGKTRLAQACATLLRDDETGSYFFEAVRPDWRDNRALLGFYNPLAGRYESTTLLRFILDAQLEVTPPPPAALSEWLEARYRSKDVQGLVGSVCRPADPLTGQAPEPDG